uniref:Uncharacterized protein n=1 Tax=Romanomermis culicivorax TaxID=13658 RepID=A0A915KGI0_ROMCU
MGVRRCKKQDLKRIAKATGEIVLLMQPVEGNQNKKPGKAENVNRRRGPTENIETKTATLSIKA